MDIKRGDMFYVKKLDTTGTIFIAGRPAIVVSNDAGNHFSDFVEVVYLTSQQREQPLPTHVPIKAETHSIALCEQIHTINQQRLGTHIRTLTQDEMQKIDDALLVSLGIKKENNEALKLELDITKEELKQIKQQKQLVQEDETFMKLKLEREFYKEQYDMLLEKLVGKAV